MEQGVSACSQEWNTGVGGCDFNGGAAAENTSSSEEGSYVRLKDFVCHSTLGLRVIKKKRRTGGGGAEGDRGWHKHVQ